MFTITWMGNAVLKISDGNTRFILDPFFSRNPELPSLKDSDLEDIEAILLTHGHFDHAVDIPRISKQTKCPIYTPLEVVPNLTSKIIGDSQHLIPVTSGDRFQLGEFSVKVFSARHVSFDLPLIGQTIANLIRYGLGKHDGRLLRNLSDHRSFPMGACIAWEISVGKKNMLHLGSMAFDPNEKYPDSPEILSLPFQGHSRISELAIKAVERFNPKSVLLHHFDDAFPPISQQIPTEPFVAEMQKRYPKIPVHIPEYHIPIEIG